MNCEIGNKLDKEGGAAKPPPPSGLVRLNLNVSRNSNTFLQSTLLLRVSKCLDLMQLKPDRRPHSRLGKDTTRAMANKEVTRKLNYYHPVSKEQIGRGLQKKYQVPVSSTNESSATPHGIRFSEFNCKSSELICKPERVPASNRFRARLVRPYFNAFKQRLLHRVAVVKRSARIICNFIWRCVIRKRKSSKEFCAKLRQFRSMASRCVADVELIAQIKADLVFLLFNPSPEFRELSDFLDRGKRDGSLPVNSANHPLANNFHALERSQRQLLRCETIMEFESRRDSPQKSKKQFVEGLFALGTFFKAPLKKTSSEAMLFNSACVSERKLCLSEKRHNKSFGSQTWAEDSGRRRADRSDHAAFLNELFDQIPFQTSGVSVKEPEHRPAPASHFYKKLSVVRCHQLPGSIGQLMKRNISLNKELMRQRSKEKSNSPLETLFPTKKTNYVKPGPAKHKKQAILDLPRPSFVIQEHNDMNGLRLSLNRTLPQPRKGPYHELPQTGRVPTSLFTMPEVRKSAAVQNNSSQAPAKRPDSNQTRPIQLKKLFQIVVARNEDQKRQSSPKQPMRKNMLGAVERRFVAHPSLKYILHPETRPKEARPEDHLDSPLKPRGPPAHAPARTELAAKKYTARPISNISMLIKRLPS